MDAEATHRAAVDDSALLDAIQAKALASRPGSRLVRRAALLATAGGAALVALWSVVTVGWLLDLPALTQVRPGLASMKLMTAGCLGAVGAAIMLSRGTGSTPRRAVRVLSVLVGAVAATVLAEYASGASWGVDNWFGLDVDPDAEHPGRMSAATASGLLILATSLLLLSWRKVLAAQLVAVLCLAVATMTLIGYVYGVESLYQFGPFDTVAVHTATGLWVASVAVLLLRSDEGFVFLAVGNTAGGVILRRLLPVALLTPVVVGALAVQAIQHGVLEDEVALAMFVTLTSALCGTQVWWQATRLRHVDLRRAGAEEAFALAREALAARDVAESRLRRANADLADFSAAMAHDLRTPLAVVKGYAELLASAGPDIAMRDDWVRRIDDAADRGTHLIDDILAFAAIGHVVPGADGVALDALARSVAEQEVAGADREARVEVLELPAVRGDAGLIRQLLANLVGNAVKYVPSDRVPVVVVDAVHGPKSHEVVVRVADNGDPIDDEERSRIFEMFQRGSTSHGTPGTGIGLAICRRIAELHGGRVWVETPTSGGVRFCVALTAA